MHKVQYIAFGFARGKVHLTGSALNRTIDNRCVLTADDFVGLVGTAGISNDNFKLIFTRTKHQVIEQTANVISLLKCRNDDADKHGIADEPLKLNNPVWNVFVGMIFVFTTIPVNGLIVYCCMSKIIQVFSILLIMSLPSCSQKTVQSTSKPVSHELWNELLKLHVDTLGHVSYKGFVKDSLRLNEYLAVLKSAHPNETNWSKEERMAYWINAYNAFTVQLIVRHYPCKSIKDLGGKLYKINTPWDIRFIIIEGQDYDLNNIEHDILRKEFDEPRIHFALNCASVSCPALRNEAYTAEKLDGQLTDQAKRFLADPTKNKVGKNAAQLSKLFSWFTSDFTKKMNLIAFINQYTTVQMDPKARIDYLEYDWKLNE